jgi:hypothetical protein
MSTLFNPQFTSDTDFSLSQLYKAARARTWPGRTPLPVEDVVGDCKKGTGGNGSVASQPLLKTRQPACSIFPRSDIALFFYRSGFATLFPFLVCWTSFSTDLFFELVRLALFDL